MEQWQSQRPVEKALVLAKDPWLRRALRRAVVTVFSCPVTTAPKLPLHRRAYDLVVLDVDLLEPDAFELIAPVIARRPRPITVVLASNAPPCAAFELGRLGVEAFLQKPFELSDLRAALIDATRAKPPSLELLGRSWVGRVDMRSAQGDLKRGMLEQALLLSHGNLTRAADILRVSRQSLQQAMRGTRMGTGTGTGTRTERQ
jgi:DNA-binding NtrC family response regulator